MNNVQKMNAALARRVRVKTWWGCEGLTGAAFRAWFLTRLMDKINRDDRRTWRRLTPDFQTKLFRDAERLKDLQRRIIHRQFETDIVNHRFSHLLTKD